jgi:hypothetical protein
MSLMLHSGRQFDFAKISKFTIEKFRFVGGLAQKAKIPQTVVWGRSRDLNDP